MLVIVDFGVPVILGTLTLGLFHHSWLVIILPLGRLLLVGNLPEILKTVLCSM